MSGLYMANTRVGRTEDCAIVASNFLSAVPFQPQTIIYFSLKLKMPRQKIRLEDLR